MSDSDACIACDTEGLKLSAEGRCAWCQADADGSPFGRCPNCHGARARNLTCACLPKLTEIQRRNIRRCGDPNGRAK